MSFNTTTLSYSNNHYRNSSAPTMRNCIEICHCIVTHSVSGPDFFFNFLKDKESLLSTIIVLRDHSSLVSQMENDLTVNPENKAKLFRSEFYAILITLNLIQKNPSPTV